MKQSYITKAFQKTVKTQFPAQSEALNAAFQKRLTDLWVENAGASRELQEHLEVQILPGIAAYETLQTVMPKADALKTVHGYVEERAWKIKKVLVGLMHLPGLYKKIPGIAAKTVRKTFGAKAGFAATELQTDSTTWRIDMTKCPYHDTCVRYGCPELCPSFCDSDDITYDGLHENLLWRRTKTLGRGDDCCDFCLKLK